MGLPQKAVTFRAKGLSDTLDGTNAFAGAMQSLQNLCLAPNTPSLFVPRVGAISQTNFPGFTTPGIVSAIKVIGTLAYGMVASQRFPGHDEPFVFNILTGTFLPISGVTSANTPLTPPSIGDWVPPTIAQPSPARTLFTHPGFSGSNFFGWLDTSNFSITTLKGNTTSGSPIIQSINDGATSAPIIDGVAPGMVLTNAVALGFAAGSTVLSLTNGTFSLSTTGNTHGTTTLDGLASTTGVLVGMGVYGPQFATGTYVAAIVSGTQVTLSAAALGTATATTVNFSGGGTITMSSNCTATANLVSLSISGGTPSTPQWAAGNTNGNPLFAVPTCVAGFNGRAWFGVKNYAVFSDTLNSTQVSFASQALALDSTPITAMAGDPLTSQLSGGIVQALIVFKGAGALYQITGDAATGNLMQNVIAGSVGTLAPLSICETPLGMAFVAPDGLRILGPNAQVTEPIGNYGKGVSVPFINALYPTRMCAAFNHDTLRISVQNGLAQGQPWQDYWLTFSERVWTGPHTFPAQILAAVPNGPPGIDFLFASNAFPGQMFSQAVIPTATAVYQENGMGMSWQWVTSLLPDNEQGAMNAIIEATVMLSLGVGQTLVLTVYDESGNILDVVNIGSVPAVATRWDAANWDGAPWDSNAGVPGTLWGTVNWGSFTWGASTVSLEQLPIAFHVPIVFRQGVVGMAGPSIAGFAIGNLYMGYEILGYMLQRLPV